MTQDPNDPKQQELSQEELEQQNAAELPGREAMSLINPSGVGGYPIDDLLPVEPDPTE